jgi:hypothetical protein
VLLLVIHIAINTFNYNLYSLRTHSEASDKCELG